jgi:hypothetical protein
VVEEAESVADWALAATAKMPAAMKEVKRILTIRLLQWYVLVKEYRQRAWRRVVVERD